MILSIFRLRKLGIFLQQNPRNEAFLSCARIFLSLTASFSQEIYIDTVFFRFDSEDISEEGMVQLDSMAKVMVTYPSYFVEILATRIALAQLLTTLNYLKGGHDQ